MNNGFLIKIAAAVKSNSIFNGSQRTIRAKKNILSTVLLKGCSVVVSFLLVPVTLGYLNQYEYGIWLTLSSILMWINYFDAGLGNGLRNKLAEALAVNDRELAGIYVSTAFFLLAMIVFAVYIIFLLAQFRLDWYKILNVPPDSIRSLNSLVSIVFLFFCISFVLRIIGNIYLANQLPAVNDLLVFLGNVLSLLLIFVFTRISTGDLTKTALTYSCMPVLVYSAAYPVTFFCKYPYLRPKISAVNFKYSKDLLGLGLQFFIVQITCLIVFSTSNLLINRMLGPEQVTTYNIAFKYFSAITMIFGIVIAPMWSAITDAYTRNEFDWIKRAVRGMRFIWLALFIVTIIMILLSNIVYRIWVGEGIKIPLSLSVLMGVYVTISNWNNIYAYFINGVGKIRLQLYCAIICGIVFLPLAIEMCKRFGMNGIIAAMCIVLLPGSIILIQYGKIINKTAIGIWNK
jgi:O-antigen/teichoic acid export membrane protein